MPGTRKLDLRGLRTKDGNGFHYFSIFRCGWKTCELFKRCSRRIRPSQASTTLIVVSCCPLTFDLTTSSLGDDWLCCSSDKGTVHVFALQDYTLNKRSALSTLGVPGAYAGTWHSGPLSLLCKGLFRVKSSGSPIREPHLNLDDCSAFSTFLGIVQYNF